MSGAFAVTSSRTVCGTACWTSTRSATATSWCASTLPASDASAPFGNRIAKDGVCSNESGVEKSRTFMNGLQNSCGGRSLLYTRARGCDSLPMFRANVRFGSKADICSAQANVRFTAKNGHVRCNERCPLSANSGH